MPGLAVDVSQPFVEGGGLSSAGRASALALDAGALVFGAVVAVTLSTRGQISFASLWGALAASALASVPRAALAVAAFLGVGCTIVRAFAPEAGRRLSRLEFGFLAWVVGLLVASQCFWILGVVGLYRPAVLLGFQIAGALALSAHLFWSPRGHSEQVAPGAGERVPRLVLLALIGAVAGAYLACALGTRLVHWDALQYHLGFPMWYLRLGRFEHFPSHLMSGIYLGVDVLYGTVLATAEPLRTVPAKLLSWAFGGTAIVAVFLTARRLGAARHWALVATLAMLTVPAITNWGSAKNDLAAAGVALAALWLLAVAFEEREPALSLWIGLCLGYAVTVKVTMALVVPIVGVAVVWRFGWRAAARFSVGCALPVAPWAMRSWWLQGTPLYPLFRAKLDYVTELWTLRNTNGLTLSPGSFFRNVVPLLLNSDGRVVGNHSLGVPFLVAAVLAIPASFRRGVATVACLAAGAFLLTLMLRTFEGRFLTRYFLLAPAVAFPVACAWLSSRSSAPFWRTAAPLVAALGLMAAYASADSVFQALGQPPLPASIEHRGAMPNDRLEFQLGLVRQAESLLEPGEILLINDASIYLLTREFVNAHALHSTVFRYDRLDADGLARQLRAMGVSAALIRRGIPGLQPQVKEVLERYGTRVAGPRRLAAYDLVWDTLGEGSE